MKHPSHTSKIAAAFTLLEILIVFSICAVLLGIGYGSYAKMQAQKQSTACLSNMRQIGLAMLLYTGENNTLLPGPLWRGQSPLVTVDAEGAADLESGNLASFLAPYLKVEAQPGSPALSSVFTCPAWKAAPQSQSETICYYSAGLIPIAPITPEENEETAPDMLAPFGDPSLSSGEPTLPARLVNLPSPANTPALWEFDRTITTSANFYNNDPRVPQAPVHKSTRTVLYFDAHVKISPANAIQ